MTNGLILFQDPDKNSVSHSQIKTIFSNTFTNKIHPKYGTKILKLNKVIMERKCEADCMNEYLSQKYLPYLEELIMKESPLAPLVGPPTDQ